MFLPGVFCIFAFAVYAIIASRSVYFKRMTLYDDKACSASSTLFESQVNSILVCLSVCVADIQCYSVFHNSDTKTCRGCNDSHFDELVPVEANGFVGYQKSKSLQNRKQSNTCTYLSFSLNPYSLQRQKIAYIARYLENHIKAV